MSGKHIFLNIFLSVFFSYLDALQERARNQTSFNALNTIMLNILVKTFLVKSM